MIELLWPSRCAGCGVLHGGRLCLRCTPPGVHRVPTAAAGVAGVWTVCGYDTAAGKALRHAKYAPDRALMCTLATVFARRIGPALGGRAWTVVPVPSPWPRRVRRGFSPAAVLAGALAGHTGRPAVSALGARALLGLPHQAALGASARRANLRGRFRSRRAVPGPVLLVDDVITTGATATACADELLGHATREVWLATFCGVRRRDAAVKDL